MKTMLCSLFMVCILFSGVADASDNWTLQYPSPKPSERQHIVMTYLGENHLMNDPPQVTVTYPNGGETLTDSVTITWIATDPDPGETDLLMVDLDYSDDAGSSWSFIDSNQSNDGAYFWDISGLSDGMQYLVRITVTDTLALSASDTSDAVFAIDNPDPPQVTVTYPNGGESLAGSDTLAWMATDPDPGDSALLVVDLHFSDDAGSTWSVIDSNQANNGSFVWDTSDLSYGMDFLIRITVTDPTDLVDFDISDSVFTICNAPHIVSIKDVPDDQGKQVLMLWDSSCLDTKAHRLIYYYSIWRRHLAGAKIELTGKEWDGSLPKDFTQSIYRRIERDVGSGETKTEYWELIGTVIAHLLEGYAFIAPTLEDSSDSSIPYFTFFVSAHSGDPFVFWDSFPDSGYSVDNISPAEPKITILTAGSSDGPVNTIWLAWEQVTTGADGSLEPGPIWYKIYCAETPNFTSGPGNLLSITQDLDYLHTDSRIGDPAVNLFYLVTAVDESDNESDAYNQVGEFDKRLKRVK